LGSVPGRRKNVRKMDVLMCSPFLGMQSISCADVADVCVKALHNPTARNKSFEVSDAYQ
jgi:hypothetical protein